eukprot:m.31220 g.31220  ORF g.31220 m.31220 type:complete len:971 (-) comp10676_c0_seq2:39-2951(-)
MSDFSQRPDTVIPAELRIEFSLLHLYKTQQARTKPSAGVQALNDQLKRIEEALRHETAMYEELQEYLKQKSRLEYEHTQSLTKLTQQFHQRAKFPDWTYKHGHDNILAVDLYRMLLETDIENAIVQQHAAEKVFKMATEQMETRLEDKRSMDRCATRVLTALQDALCDLDASVTKAKKMYDVGMKELEQFQKKKGAKKKPDYESRLRALESKANSLKTEYLLELSAANAYYLKFRNEQFPEVFDTINRQTMEWMQAFLKTVLTTQAHPASELVSSSKTLEQRTGLLDPEFERRTFMHNCRKEFPGRQIFQMQPYHADEDSALEVSVQTKLILVQMRNLLRHHVDTMTKELEKKEEQVESLLQLYQHYTKAGAILDKSQNQAEVMKEKMELVYAQIETLAIQRSHLQSKIDFITQSGVDEMEDLSVSSHPQGSGVIDITEAQEREAERRRHFHEMASNFSTAESTDDDAHLETWNEESRQDPPTPLSPTSARKAGLLSNVLGLRRRRDTPSPQSKAGASKHQDMDGTPPPPPPPPGMSSPSLSRNQHALMKTSMSTPPPPPPPPPPLGMPTPSQPESTKPVHPDDDSSSDDGAPVATFLANSPLLKKMKEKTTTSPSAPSPPPFKPALQVKADVTSTGTATSPPPPPPPPPPPTALLPSPASVPTPPVAVPSPPTALLPPTQNTAQQAASPPPPPPPTVPFPGNMLKTLPLPPPPETPAPEESNPLENAVFFPPPPPALASPLPSDDVPLDEETDGVILRNRPRGRKQSSSEDIRKSLRAPPPPPPPVPEEPVILPPREAMIPLYRALYDYDACQQDDLALTAREILFVLVVREDGWSLGLSLHGTVGFLPSSYVEEIKDTSKYTYPKARLVHVPRDHAMTDLHISSASPAIVSKVNAGSIAERCGLLQGDLIIEVNSKPCATKTSDSIKKLLRAAPGEHIALCVLNKNELLESAETLNASSKRPSNLNLV